MLGKALYAQLGRWQRTAVLAVATDDRSIVQRAAGGDARAFQHLYRQHQARVRATLYSLCDADGLDDLVQEVFLRVWRGLPRFRGSASFSTWLYRITWNVASDRRRELAKNRARRLESTADPDLAERAIEQAIDPQTQDKSPLSQLHYQDLVQRSLAILGFEARAVLVLCDLEDVSQKEAAEILGIPVGTVKSRLFYARAQIRQFLQQQGVEL
ncbi:MAG: sigma-70 family RNA polymerase sigma factor [Limnothrix sp. BL-A-16]|jgi:RNA polymerase sigma-70 factor (ECF subfamily)